MSDVKVEDLDVYSILKLPDDCTTQDIKRAYRKAALECHPDKNPDDAEAATKFIQLGAILKLLLEPHARNAYDALRRARMQARLRLEKQDSVRKKLREDLERRERESAAGKLDQRTAEEKLRAEVERLRKESSRQLEEAIAEMQRQVEEDLARQKAEGLVETCSTRLKLKWKRGYGRISALVISKKGGSALLEYERLNDVDNLVEHETGNSDNPIQVTWVSGKPAPKPVPEVDTENEIDFEEMVLRRLHEAQKKQETE
ncbi:UNVERIFIED_CONTAM: hypothetical protein B566_EDAN014215 [Ephemera danica]|nr:hypothetical protein B566_EDAN014215 [Ephemera danica]